MKGNVFLNLASFFLILGILVVVGIYICKFIKDSNTSRNSSSLDCEVDSDCIVFGKTGDCNCGCYNKNNLPNESGGECFCQTPTSCVCADGQCMGVFQEEEADVEISDSDCMGMSLEEAEEIAGNSECGGDFKNNFTCNEITNTWWIDLDIEKEGCSPACVINTKTKEAEINWRCTGLAPAL